jgi:hypothetical protein
MPDLQYACFPAMKYITILVCATLINTLLTEFGIIALPLGPGVSGLYIAVAVMIVFSLWFGMYGAIAAYLGSFFGAWIISGLPVPVNLIWSLADLWQVLIPLAAFTMLKADIRLITTRDFGVFILFGWLLNNAVGALWGAGVLVLTGASRGVDFGTMFSGWLIGNLIVTILIVPPLLWFATPAIEKKGLRIRGYWA